MSAAVLETRPTNPIAIPEISGTALTDILQAPSSTEGVTPSLRTLIHRERRAHRIVDPQDIALSNIIGFFEEARFPLINGETWTLHATPETIFTGLPKSESEEISLFTQPPKNLDKFFRELKRKQFYSRQLGNTDRERHHAKSAHFFASNWGAPCATEVKLANEKVLDFIGLTAEGRIIIVDFTSDRLSRIHYKKMQKLMRQYQKRLKIMYKETYDETLPHELFVPLVINHDFFTDEKSLTIHDKYHVVKYVDTVQIPEVANAA